MLDVVLIVNGIEINRHYVLCRVHAKLNGLDDRTITFISTSD